MATDAESKNLSDHPYYKSKFFSHFFVWDLQHSIEMSPTLVMERDLFG